MRNPTMPEIRQTIDLARQQVGREDTESFALVAPGLIARLVEILDLYVSFEPTLAEEEEYVRQQHRAEVLAEAKTETVAWLVKKAAEQPTWDAAVLASKVDRGAVRAFIGTGHYRDAMDAHRAEVRREVLRDFLGRLEDSAGESVVEQLLAHNPELSKAWKDTREGESTEAAGVVQYGIRHGNGEVQPAGGDREFAAGTRARMRATTHPGAVLVQRTITPGSWTPVEGEAGR